MHKLNDISHILFSDIMLDLSSFNTSKFYLSTKLIIYDHFGYCEFSFHLLGFSFLSDLFYALATCQCGI